MTLLEVEELVDYWGDHPPVHLLVGAYLGVGKPAAERKPAAAAPGMPSVMQTPDLPPGLEEGDIYRGCAEPPLFDFVAAKARERENFSRRETARPARRANFAASGYDKTGTPAPGC